VKHVNRKARELHWFWSGRDSTSGQPALFQAGWSLRTRLYLQMEELEIFHPLGNDPEMGLWGAICDL
jgi:hypothetical protein